MKKLYIFSFLIILSASNIFSQSGWYQVASNFPNYTRSLDFVNDLTGFIVCNDGVILKTTNGGYNWFNIYNLPNILSYRVYFINSDTVFLIVDRGRF